MLVDAHKRSFQYLRLSVTDRCNFKCTYCLPNGYKKGFEQPELSVAEIKRLVTVFAALGFWKIRLTGGEPTLRQDLVEIAHVVSSVPGIQKVALSTNGSRFKEIAQDLRTAGVSAVNLSLDTLSEEKFREITGSRRFQDVHASVDQALELGFEVKVNVVLLKSHFDFEPFLNFIRTRRVSVRFIELMQTAENADLFSAEHMSALVLEQRLSQLGFQRQERISGAGPAKMFSHPDAQGSIGVIAPYSKDFCTSCNRLRVTSRGDLRLCLFGDGRTSLRDLLQSDGQHVELQERVVQSLGLKKISHELLEGRFGDTPNLSVYGG